MTRRIDSVFSFVLYGAGVLSLLIADLLVSERNDVVFTSDWAFLKSSILIIGSASLLGYDQLFVRDPSLIERVAKRLCGQALVIVGISSVVIWLFREASFIHLVATAFSILLFALLSFWASAHRGFYNLWKAQMAANFWKVLLLPILWFLSLTPSSVFILALMAGVVSVIAAGLPNDDQAGVGDWQIMDDKDASGLSRIFFLTNITLLVASYGEQMILNFSNDRVASAVLFSHFAIFAPISIGLNGFIGFVLGPKIRRVDNFRKRDFMQLTYRMILYAFFAAIVSVVVGYLYVVKVSSMPLDAFSPMLVLVVTLTGVVRCVYVITSVSIGIHGDRKALGRLARDFWISTAAFLVLSKVAVDSFDGIMAAHAIALLALINWSARLVLSYAQSIAVLK